METVQSDEHRTTKKRDRSRSPSDEADATARKQRCRQSFLKQVEGARSELDAYKKMWEWEDKAERRHNLKPSQRLMEDGAQLRREIESDPEITAFLEMSRSQRAKCRAGDDSLYVQAKANCRALIWNDYRIRLDGVQGDWYWAKTKHYYHVHCFDYMVGLKDLIPSKFRLDDSCWSLGLIVRKWYEYKGNIDLDKIETYIKEHKAYVQKKWELSKARDAWYEDHTRCKDNPALTCNCPPEPRSPEEPVLKDYVTEGDGPALSDILGHPDVEETCDEWFEQVIKQY